MTNSVVKKKVDYVSTDQNNDFTKLRDDATSSVICEACSTSSLLSSDKSFKCNICLGVNHFKCCGLIDSYGDLFMSNDNNLNVWLVCNKCSSQQQCTPNTPLKLVLLQPVSESHKGDSSQAITSEVGDCIIHYGIHYLFLK